MSQADVDQFFLRLRLSYSEGKVFERMVKQGIIQESECINFHVHRVDMKTSKIEVWNYAV